MQSIVDAERVAILSIRIKVIAFFERYQAFEAVVGF